MSQTVYAMSDDELHQYLAVDTAARHTRTALRNAVLDAPDIVHAVRNGAPTNIVIDLIEQLALRLDRAHTELDDALTGPAL